jgi:hypothetical protein
MPPMQRGSGGNSFLIENRLLLNEEVASKGIINCTHAVELRNIGKYLYKIECKWENKISNV